VLIRQFIAQKAFVLSAERPCRAQRRQKDRCHREEQKRRGDLVAHIIRTFRDCFVTVFLAMTNGCSLEGAVASGSMNKRFAVPFDKLRTGFETTAAL